MQTDVLIIGAGPTGLTLACQCVRFALDFLLVEKNPSITPFSKAIGVQARTLEIYEQLNIAQDALNQGTIASKVRLLEGEETRAELPLSQFGAGLSPYPFLLMLEQSKNEKLLRDYLLQHGKDALWQSTLESFTQNEDNVVAHIKTADGQTQIVEARYLVGCDGAKSPVRHALGLSFEGRTQPHLFYVADAHIQWKLPHDAVQICLSREVLTAFFPLVGENRYRIVGTFPEDSALAKRKEGEVLYDEIEAQIIREAKLQLDITDVSWFSTYKVHSRCVNRFQSGRCFVAGDAAHIHTPAGAQGMNTGIQDAYNLAWKMAMVIKGQAAPKLLETYNEERLANAHNLLQTTDRFFEVGAGANPILAFLRMTILPSVLEHLLGFSSFRRVLFPLISQIGINYRGAALSDKSHEDFKVKAGDRMPYFEVQGQSIYNFLRDPKWHLLTFASAGNRDSDISKFPVPLDVRWFDSSPQIAEISGAREPFSILLRPDNYIAALAPVAQMDVADYARAHL